LPIEAGTPIVVLEPSCLAVFRDEMPDLLPYDQDAKRFQQQAFTLAEFFEKRAPHFQPAQMRRAAIFHGHCHQKAVIGTGCEQELLRKIGLELTALDDGCCGMAGSFGFEPSKYEVSMKVGELATLPKVREAPKDTLIIADGFSCKTQIEQGTDRHALHLAQVLKMASLDGAGLSVGQYPERRWLKLDRNDGHLREAVTAGIGLALGGLLYWTLRRGKRHV